MRQLAAIISKPPERDQREEGRGRLSGREKKKTDSSAHHKRRTVPRRRKGKRRLLSWK